MRSWCCPDAGQHQAIGHRGCCCCYCCWGRCARVSGAYSCSGPESRSHPPRCLQPAKGNRVLVSPPPWICQPNQGPERQLSCKETEQPAWLAARRGHLTFQLPGSTEPHTQDTIKTWAGPEPKELACSSRQQGPGPRSLQQPCCSRQGASNVSPRHTSSHLSLGCLLRAHTGLHAEVQPGSPPCRAGPGVSC